MSGQSPLVDTRSVSKAQVISQETLSALPTAKSVGSMLAFVPGAVSPANGVDSGGSKGEQSVRISVFGARPNDQRQMTNGLMYTNLNGDGGGRLYFVNPVTIQENVIDLGAAGSALYQTSGAVVNTIPREGGNRFSGTGFGAYTNHNLQASNLSDDLKAWGLTVVNGVRKIYDVNGLFGGPLVKDKWWFVVSGRQKRQRAARGQPVPRLEPQRLDLHARYQPAGRSGRIQPELSVPDDVPARHQGQVRRLYRHPAPLS